MSFSSTSAALSVDSAKDLKTSDGNQRCQDSEIESYRTRVVA